MSWPKRSRNLSTWDKKVSATSESSVTMHSVWALPRHQIKHETFYTIKLVTQITKMKFITTARTCLPCLFMWLMAAKTSSTISIVQASELYSWCKELASEIFSKALAFGPPYNSTPASHFSLLIRVFRILRQLDGLFCIVAPCILNHHKKWLDLNTKLK